MVHEFFGASKPISLKSATTFQKIQAKMTLTLRRKKTLSELIDAITQIALRHEDELLQAEELPPAEKDPAVAPPFDREVKTDASKMDEYIYLED